MVGIDDLRLRADLIHDLNRVTGFEAVMRVRCVERAYSFRRSPSVVARFPSRACLVVGVSTWRSCTKGLRVTNFYGNFFIRGTDLLALPNVTEDTAFNLDIAHEVCDVVPSGAAGAGHAVLCDAARCHSSPTAVSLCLSVCVQEALQPGTVIGIQAALLYTTSSGERRINVHTMAVPVSCILVELFKKVRDSSLPSSRSGPLSTIVSLRPSRVLVPLRVSRCLRLRCRTLSFRADRVHWPADDGVVCTRCCRSTLTR
jgi:hypothetical protein